jgi:hypothetical protein
MAAVVGTTPPSSAADERTSVTQPSGVGPPFALDGTVTAEKLHELLAVQSKSAWLDYKVACDLSQAADLVEIAKDVAAMSIDGGYIVVGVDDAGRLAGLAPKDATLYDLATLTDKLARYLPAGTEIRSAQHTVPGAGGAPVAVALVWVGPHADGWCVFARTGDYPVAGGKTRTAFRKGDVYARHGSRSESWDQNDIAVARRRLVAQQKDQWRAEHAHEVRLALQAASGAVTAAGPTGAFTWRLDAAGFEDAFVELIRRDDDIPVRRMLRTATSDVLALLASDRHDAADDVLTVLDRLTAAAALALDLERDPYFRMFVDALLAVYGAGVDRQYLSGPVPSAVLWLRVAERLHAVGALAVRLGRWEAVRILATAPVPALRSQYGDKTWHRHALTQSSRADLLRDALPDGSTRAVSLLLFSRAAAATLPALRPDLAADLPAQAGDADPLLASICQYDLLAAVASAIAVGAATERAVLDVSYPNFADAYGERANAVVAPLVHDPDVRRAVAPGASDADLARVLVLLAVQRAAQPRASSAGRASPTQS